MIRLLILAEVNSSHTIKWVQSLAKEKMQITLFGFASLRVSAYDAYENIKIITQDASVESKEASLSKLKYFKAHTLVQKIIADFKPDILHAHYASSYGLIAALSSFSPFVLSAWGSDIFSFPKSSFFHKYLLKYTLNRADILLSTSEAMAKEMKLYTQKEVRIIPFGIETEYFCAQKVQTPFEKECIVIGTIKALEEVYGIEYLIKAFAIVSHENPNLELCLLIVGGGSLESKLKELVQDLGLAQRSIFVGAVPYSEVLKYHNMIDIFLNVSQNESFGVSVLEASSCSKPVIVSNVGGLPEVVRDGVSGLITPFGDVDAIAQSIQRLLIDKELRESMGVRGREMVQESFDWKESVQKCVTLYEGLLQ